MKAPQKTEREKFEDAYRRRFTSEPTKNDFEQWENSPGEVRLLFLSKHDSWLAASWGAAFLGIFGGIAIGIIVPLLNK